MKPALLIFVVATASSLLAAGQPALTIYNQNFAVVRDSVPLDLKQGVNEVRFTETTAHLEPDSVILRDPAGKTQLQILEQNYRNDPVTQELLLSLFEGKTIDFLVTEPNKPNTTVQGKIVRSGYVPHNMEAMQRYGQRYAMVQSSLGYGNTTAQQPIIEVDGKLRFSLPGQPLLPPLGNDTILKPTLEWQLQSDKAAKLDAELAYVTDGMSWEADYNVVAPEQSDLLDLVGWVTIDVIHGQLGVSTSKALPEGVCYFFLGDKEKAHASFERAREFMEKQLREAPDDAAAHAQLGFIYALLDRKDDALREGERAGQLLPESKDAFEGPQITEGRAEIFAMTGERNKALQLIEHLLTGPGGLTVPILKIDPVWDPLRNDPRFQALLEKYGAKS